MDEQKNIETEDISSINNYYKIQRSDISYDPARDHELEILFGDDYKYITKDPDNPFMSLCLYLKSINPNHCTKHGWVKLMEQVMGKDMAKWTTSHPSDMRTSGYKDHAKSPIIICQVLITTPIPMPKLITAAKQLQNIDIMMDMMGINDDDNDRIHPLRSRPRTNHTYNYRIKGISKTLISINPKDITNAMAVTDVLVKQLKFDITQTQWHRNISHETREFTTNINVTSAEPCLIFEENQHDYTLHLQINGYQTAIPVIIEWISSKTHQPVTITSTQYKNESLKRQKKL